MNENYFYGRPLQVGTETQYLMDDYMVEDRWDVQRVLNVPPKHPKNPVLMADCRWEETVISANVIFDDEEEVYRMWYVVGNMEAYHQKPGVGKQSSDKKYYQVLAYAESNDGVDWHKPALGKVNYHGFDKTNVVLTGETKAGCPLVMKTPEPLRSKGKYMVSYRDNASGGHGLYIGFSDNGIDWKTDPNNCIFPGVLDTQHNLVYDETRNIWLLYTRPLIRGAKDSDRNENVRCRIAVAVSEDVENLKQWHPIRNVIEPDNVDNDNLHFFDHMVVTKCGGHFFGLLSVNPREGSGTGHLEPAFSSDGFNWNRMPDKKPYIDIGREGDFDAGHTWCAKKIVTAGDWMHIYYGASDRPWRLPEKQTGIGMVRFRKGRFIGQFADEKGGFLLTRQMIAGGDELEINCACLHHTFNRGMERTAKIQHGSGQFGYIKVELLGPDGKAIEGYTFDDCDDITAKSTHYTVSWNGKTDISKLKGKPVYVRFYLQNSYLYSIRFAGE